MGILYIIATPIGNLEDITLRAKRMLESVDIVACEDTRVTGKLLSLYGIKKKLLSFHAHSPEKRAKEIVSLLEEGKNIALVSDAGTPAISDPGSFLVDAIYKETGDLARVIPVPGASSLTTALSASGFPSSEFLFLGFLPHKKGRETLFKEIAATSRTVVFFESPHRIMKTLDSLVKVLPSDREIAIGRELTKIHEEIVRGSSDEVRGYYKNHTDKQRGEFVVMVSPK